MVCIDEVGPESLQARAGFGFPLGLSFCRHACRLWRVEEDDQLPTLAELFQQLPEKVSFDIEVKMTTPDSAPCTAPAEIQRMADAILRIVQQQRQRGKH